VRFVGVALSVELQGPGIFPRIQLVARHAREHPYHAFAGILINEHAKQRGVDLALPLGWRDLLLAARRFRAGLRFLTQ